MIKLKSETWYYVYTNGKDVFISETAPIKEDQHWYYPKRWYHFKHQHKVTGVPIWIADPESSGNIAEFIEFGEREAKRIIHEKEN